MKINFKQLDLMTAAVVIEILFEWMIENLIGERNAFIAFGIAFMLVAFIYVVFKRKNG